ncbi:MAG: hypothetical protein PHC43_00880 [Candidatus Marinimicrobia bacterium]|jgi:hypothetical protein|nr:hypothetical protein [Candidatus Neomarinimicrobiota bacterium]
MKAFFLKIILGKEALDIFRKYYRFTRPYSQEGSKLSPDERQDLIKELWPFLLAISNIINFKKGKKQ